MSANANNYNK